MLATFIAAVREGRIEGLSVRDDRGTEFFLGPSSIIGDLRESGDKSIHFWPAMEDHLCAHLRRWMESKGWHCNLSTTQLSIGIKSPTRTIPKHFKDGTEIDQHVAAALWVLEQEGEAK
jgi:hypothetical protein